MILPTENALNKQNQEPQAKVKLDNTQVSSHKHFWHHIYARCIVIHLLYFMFEMAISHILCKAAQNWCCVIWKYTIIYVSLYIYHYILFQLFIFLCLFLKSSDMLCIKMWSYFDPQTYRLGPPRQLTLPTLESKFKQCLSVWKIPSLPHQKSCTGFS